MDTAALCKDRKFLVTGASGFIGAAVCERLLELGATVQGTARSNVQFDSARYQHTSADLADPAAVDRMVSSSEPQYVLHLAGCAIGNRGVDWVRETLVGNLQSTVNLLVAAQKCGVEKCVLAGSLEEPHPGDSLAVPTSPYAASKWSASGYARMMHALFGMEIAIARIAMAYGPGQRDTSKFVPHVCLSASRGEAPKIMSGDRLVDWIFISDVVDVLILMSFVGPTDGGHVDVGSGNLVSTGEVAGRICAIASTGVAPQLGAVPDRPMEQERVADAASASRQIDWKAKVDLDDGLAKTYRWFRERANGS